MIVCPIRTDGYCDRHQRRHIGHAAQIAIEKTEKAERIRRTWDGWGGTNVATARSINLRVYDSCIHRDGSTKYEGRCGLYSFGCRLRGKASTSRLCKDATYCPECLDFRTKPAAPYQEIRTRHLLYHIYPVSGNGAWQWNVEQLCGRLRAFDGGKKIVAIVTDPPTGRRSDPSGAHPPDRARMIPGCDSAEAVREEFARRWSGEPITFLEMENDPTLREVVSLVPMLEMIPHDDPHSVTLYAQAKGTTRHPNHIWRRWTEALYEVVLDHFPLAMEQLMERPCTGAFKKLGPGWSPDQSKSDWHFSGSWFWFRNVELFAKDWKKADQFWSGIEPYPSQQFLASEADCMFHTARVPDMNLYAQAYWRKVVFPELNKFRADNAKWRTDLWPK